MPFQPLTHVDRITATQNHLSPAHRDGEDIAYAVETRFFYQVALGALQRLGNLFLSQRFGRVNFGLECVEAADFGDELGFLAIPAGRSVILWGVLRRTQ